MRTLQFGYHVTTKENWAKIQQYGLKPQIGHLSSKADEDKSKIFFFISEEEAENALLNWLGEELEELYGEEVELVLLRVDLRSLKQAIEVDDNGVDFFEQAVDRAIDPSLIEYLRDV